MKALSKRFREKPTFLVDPEIQQHCTTSPHTISSFPLQIIGCGNDEFVHDIVHISNVMALTGVMALIGLEETVVESVHHVTASRDRFSKITSRRILWLAAESGIKNPLLDSLRALFGTLDGFEQRRVRCQTIKRHDPCGATARLILWYQAYTYILEYGLPFIAAKALKKTTGGHT
jgi:hypothetical protein